METSGLLTFHNHGKEVVHPESIIKTRDCTCTTTLLGCTRSHAVWSPLNLVVLETGKVCVIQMVKRDNIRYLVSQRKAVGSNSDQAEKRPAFIFHGNKVSHLARRVRVTW